MSDPRLGRRPDPPDARDHRLAAYLAPVALPASHSAPSFPVLDQGQTPQCVAYSGSLIRAMQERRDEHRLLGFDAADLYAHCKAIDGYPTEDGTDIRSGCKVLTKDGALIRTSPIPAEIEQRRKVAAYARLLSVDDIKQSIFAYGAAWLGSSWYNSWFNPKSDGTLPAPDSVAGGHAYTAIGWSDKRAALRCQNSWGASWGSKGRFWLPYRFIDFTDTDAWHVVDVAGDF